MASKTIKSPRASSMRSNCLALSIRSDSLRDGSAVMVTADRSNRSCPFICQCTNVCAARLGFARSRSVSPGVSSWVVASGVTHKIKKAANTEKKNNLFMFVSSLMERNTASF